MTEIDKFPVKELANRYNIGRTALYSRFEAANITPNKEGTRSYISGSELEELDRLDSHIKTGGGLESFKAESSHAEVMPASIASSIEPATPAKVSGNDGENFIELIERIAAALKPAADPLQHYAALERAIASSWLLSSSEVRSLIGTRPTGDRFQRGSFVFIRTGRIGAQSAWRVVKVVIGGTPYKF